MKIFIIATIIAASCISIYADKSNRKYKSEQRQQTLNKKLTGKTKTNQVPAIIAIEIIDPKAENKTRNSKRTIDGSLGYGYHQPQYSQPRYEVYKYSQQDIPPYHGPSHFNRQDYHVQKSISYQLPSLIQYYQPGTTLYSSINNQGHASDLSKHLPQQENYNNEVPVIILKVHPSQLSSGGALHANLPQNHPLAATINSVDIQGLLANYVQNLAHNNQPQYYNQYQQQYEQAYQENPAENEPELLTHENYPKNTHTRVVFRTDKNQQGVTPSDSKQPDVVLPPIEPSYQMMQVDAHNYETDQQLYYYPQQEAEQGGADPQYYYQEVVPPEQVPPPPEPQPHHYYNYNRNQKRSHKGKRTHRTTHENFSLKPIRE